MKSIRRGSQGDERETDPHRVEEDQLRAGVLPQHRDHDRQRDEYRRASFAALYAGIR